MTTNKQETGLSMSENKRTIGKVTTSSTGGGLIAGALTVLIVYGASLKGVDIPEHVAGAITVIIGTIGALVGGWLVKPGDGEHRG